MSLRRPVLVTALVATAALALAGPAQAAENPYSPEQVCGQGFSVIQKKRMYPDDGGKKKLLATAFLLYNTGSGQNCAVTMKRARIGTPTSTVVTLKKKGRREPWVFDAGQYGYYAGPVYKPTAGHCVRFGASVAFPSGRSSLFISKFGHCR